MNFIHFRITWSKGSPPVFAENFDASGKQLSVQVKNTGWQKWKKYSIEVPVQNGEITIGIFLDANAGNWGNFDDVTLEKK